MISTARFLLMLTLATLWALPAAGQNQAPPEAQSLRMAPADCGYYSVSLRNKEQWDMLVNSRAVKKLLGSPYAQLAIGMIRTEWQSENNPQVQMIKQLLQQPENVELIKLLREAVSEEVFIYGDDRLADLLQLANRVSNVVRSAQLEAAASGTFDDSIVAQRLAEFALSNSDKLHLPQMVIGFRLQDQPAALNQIARLEKLLQDQLTESPLAGRLKREQAGQAELLTLSLDGSMLPWDEAERELDSFNAETQAKLKELFELLKKKTVAISLGVRGDFLLLSVGDSSDYVRRFGSGEPLLERDEFKPLARHLGKRFTSIGYMDADFAQKAASPAGQFEDIRSIIEQAASVAPLPADVKAEMRKDAARLSQDLKSLVPQMGAAMSFSYFSDRGFEGYAYNWTPRPTADGSKPLTILNHVGGSPLILAAGRSQSVQQQDDDTDEYWLGRIEYYLQQVIAPQLPPQQQEVMKRVITQGKPLLARLSKVGSEMLAPGLKDGQVAFVIDAKLTTLQPHVNLPLAVEPVPLPEIALVLSVSDADKLRAAADELYAIADDAIKLAREVAPQMPLEKTPRPRPLQTGGQTMHVYDLPPAAGLDKAIAPNAGLNDQALVFSMAPETSRRLLTDTPLQAEGLLAAYRDKPIAGASHVNVAGLLQMVQSWISYGVRSAAPGDPSVEATMDQVRLVFEVMQCCRSVSTVTYPEGDAWVTRSEAHFQDLAP